MKYRVAFCLSGFLIFLVQCLPCAAESFTTTDRTTLYLEPNGKEIAHLENNVTVTRLRSKGSWLQVHFEAWIHASAFARIPGPGEALYVGAGMAMKSESPQGPVIGKIYKGSEPEMAAREGDYVKALIIAWVSTELPKTAGPPAPPTPGRPASVPPTAFGSFTAADRTTLYLEPNSREIAHLEKNVTVARARSEGPWTQVRFEAWVHVSGFTRLANPGGALYVGAGMAMKSESPQGPVIGKIYKGSEPQMLAREGDYIKALIVGWATTSPPKSPSAPPPPAAPTGSSVVSKSVPPAAGTPRRAPDSGVVALMSDTETIQGLNVEMVLIPGGWFEMAPGYQVYVDTYWMGQFEITVRQWKIFLDVARAGFDWENNSFGPAKVVEFSPQENCPIVSVSWFQASAFTEWLSGVTGKKYRLPTEAEWVRAAKAGREAEYGTRSGRIDTNLANCNGCGSSWDGLRTAPVGSFPPNPFGLYDLAGNVWEWCLDWHADFPKGKAKNPSGPADGTVREALGGSWNNAAELLRISNRGGLRPGYRGHFVGFRIVRLP